MSRTGRSIATSGWPVRHLSRKKAALSDLEYCTYVSSAPGPQAIALQLNADDDVNDGDSSWKGRLVFEPANQGTNPTPGTWECWDALSGKWWATGAPLNGLAPQGSPQTLATLLATFPNAGFNSSFGGLILKAGSGWASFDGNADMLTIGGSGYGTTTFDFEPGPTTKDDCKKGGWAALGFKNQGQCVASVASGKDKRNK